MTRTILVLAVALGCLLSAGCDSRNNSYGSYPYSPPGNTSSGSESYSPPDNTSSGSDSYSWPSSTSSYGSYSRDNDSDAESAREAKEEFQDAASEMQSAVRALSFTPWRDQMHTIRGRLYDADEALERLEELRGSDPSVQAARDEIESMRSHMDRLYYENWRTVRPDLGSTSTLIEDEAFSISDSDEE